MPKPKNIDEARQIDEERFWSKVDKAHRDDGCWIWQGYRNKRTGRGHYNQVMFNSYPVRTNKFIEQAHVYAWILTHGCRPVGHGLARGSSGTVLAHKCNNGHLGCVNPDHLQVSTQSDNQRDKWANGTHQSITIKKDRMIIDAMKTRLGINKRVPWIQLAEEAGVPQEEMLRAAIAVYDKWILERFGEKVVFDWSNMAIKSKRIIARRV